MKSFADNRYLGRANSYGQGKIAHPYSNVNQFF